MHSELVQFLKEHMGAVVTLVLDDGEVVDAKVLFVDPTDHEDVIYDVIRVQVAGAKTDYTREGAYAIPLSAIVSASDPAGV